jgi:hypothetical protein
MSDQYTTEMRQDLAHTVMGVLSDWGVPQENQVQLLGLPEKTKPRALNRYRDGQQPFPGDDETMERLAHLIAIEQALSVMFSYNPALGRLWVTTESDRFGGESPLSVMLSTGVDGMRRVRNHMDGGLDW